MTDTMVTEIGPLAESLSGHGVIVPTSDCVLAIEPMHRAVTITARLHTVGGLYFIIVPLCLSGTLYSVTCIWVTTIRCLWNRIRMALQKYEYRLLGFGSRSADSCSSLPAGSLCASTQENIWDLTERIVLILCSRPPDSTTFQPTSSKIALSFKPLFGLDGMGLSR